MIPFGVTFYPDQWPVDSWEDNFKRIKAAGFNIVRFGEMAWDWVEPTPGKFNFSGLDRALNLCAKLGIKVLLGLPTSQVPPWFFRLYPGSQPVAQDGTFYPEAGPRPNICKDNPNYRRLATRLTKKIVSRYRKHPAVFFWQLDNEPVYPPLDHTTSNDFCHCNYTRRAFITWAKHKYGSLKNLNEVWGTKFWTTTYSSFADIQTPKAGIWEAGNPHIFLDWFRFKTERLAEWISHLAKTVRALDKNHKVGTNGFIGICTRVPDHSLLAKGLDWYGLDIYPKGGKMAPRDLAFSLDLWRGFAQHNQAEFHLTELQGGANVRWGCPDYVAGPEIDWWTRMAFARGAVALLYHAWRPPLFGSETGGFGILRTDGSATKRLEVIEKLAKEFSLDKAINHNLKTETAIVSLRSSEIQTYQEQGPPRGIAGQWEPVRVDIGLLYPLLSIQGAHHFLYKEGTVVDFIFEQDLPSGQLPYKVIFLPNPYLLSLSQFKGLKKWVAAGGTLVTDARFGLKNEAGHLYLKPLLNELVDLEYDHTEITDKGFLDVFANRPAKEEFIIRKSGRGKTIYANFSLFLRLKNGDKKVATRLAKLLKR